MNSGALASGVLSLALPFAMGVSLLVGCGGGDTTSTPSGECGGDDCTDACGDRVDNDGDGELDCADSDCGAAPNCMQAAYGVPLETTCADGADDDGDGNADCADSDCDSAPNCMQADYAARGEVDCENGLDDDGDGSADCADDDCQATSPNCMAGATGSRCGRRAARTGSTTTATARPTAPTTTARRSPGASWSSTGSSWRDLRGHRDNDGDGAVDCADADCTADPSCMAGARYAAPSP
jgi:hypothetical protein